MADTSAFNVEEHLVACMWVHKHPQTQKTMEDIMRDFAVRFWKLSPLQQMLLVLEKKAFVMGSVCNVPCSRRLSIHIETYAAVAESNEQSLMKSTHKQSA